MSHRLVPALLLTLLVILHGQLWLGRGSLSGVSHLQQKLDAQLEANRQARLGLDRLEAELKDLREGLDMVEEKARFELGMVKPDEIYVQLSR